MSAPDGGPAFPVMGFPGDANYTLPTEGMSLRDVFAIGPMSDVELETLKEAFSARFPGEPASIAKIRYFRADTMLETRAKWYDENRAPTPVQEPVVIPAQPGEDMQ